MAREGTSSSRGVWKTAAAMVAVLEISGNGTVSAMCNLFELSEFISGGLVFCHTIKRPMLQNSDAGALLMADADNNRKAL